MKNYYTFLLVATCFNLSYAQPTITADWYYAIGDTISTAYYYPSSDLEPTEGLDLTWDISDAPTPYGEFEIIIVAPSELNYFDEFPEATLAYKQTMEREYYLNVENGNLQQIGYRTPDYKIVFENGFPIIAYSDFEFSDEELNAYNNNLINLQTMDTTINSELDEFKFAGYGTVITPEGTYEDCVMTKLTRTSTGIFDLVEYKFHKDKLANVIASYRRYTSGSVEPTRRVEYQTERSTVSVNELSEDVLTIIKSNDNTILVKTSTQIDARIQIFDISGQLITDQSQQIFQGENEFNLDHLKENGVYVFLLIDKNTGSFRSLKFLR